MMGSSQDSTKPKTLLGRPIVEVNDMPEGEIVVGPFGVDVQGITIRPAVASTPADPVRFVVEVKTRPGLHTMEEMRHDLLHGTGRAEPRGIMNEEGR